jgi:hypothetical protein
MSAAQSQHPRRHSAQQQRDDTEAELMCQQRSQRSFVILTIIHASSHLLAHGAEQLLHGKKHDCTRVHISPCFFHAAKQAITQCTAAARYQSQMSLTDRLSPSGSSSQS